MWEVYARVLKLQEGQRAALPVDGPLTDQCSSPAEAVHHLRLIVAKLDVLPSFDSQNFSCSGEVLEFARRCEAVRTGVFEARAGAKSDVALSQMQAAVAARNGLVESQQRVCAEAEQSIRRSIAECVLAVEQAEGLLTAARACSAFASTSPLPPPTSTSPTPGLKEQKSKPEELQVPSLQPDVIFEQMWEDFQAIYASEMRVAGQITQLTEWRLAGEARQQLQVALVKLLSTHEGALQHHDKMLIEKYLPSLSVTAESSAASHMSCLKARLLDLERMQAGVGAHRESLRAFAECLKEEPEVSRRYRAMSYELEDLAVEQKVVEHQIVVARRKEAPIGALQAQLEELKAKATTLQTGPERRALHQSLRRLSNSLPELIHSFPELDPLWRTAAQGLAIYSLADYEQCLTRLTHNGQVVPNLFRASRQLDDLKTEKKEKQEVILKKFPMGDDASSLRRLRRSAHMMSRVCHPNVMPLTGILRHQGEWYLEVPFFPLGDLRQYIHTHEYASSQEECMGLLRGILQALDVLHQVGIFHRDIKPENVLLQEYPAGTGRLRAVVGDFETSKDTQTDLSRTMATTFVAGTPGYIDPLVMQGKKVFSSSSDMYSFGVLMGEMVTGIKMSSPDPVALQKVDGKTKDVLCSLLKWDADRPSAAQLLSCPLFSPLADVRCCCITQSLSPLSDGIECDNPFGERHFLCKESFAMHVIVESRKDLDQLKLRQGRVFCPLFKYGCSAPAFTDLQVAQGGSQAFEAYLEANRQLMEKGLAAQMEKDKAEQIKLELERFRKLSARQLRIESAVRHIQDNLLTLCCPRCKTCFVDFDACFALVCRSCACGFCAWCLRDCGADAHSHVAHCPNNLAPGRALFSTQALFAKAHQIRQHGLVKQYIQSMPQDVGLEVLKLLEVNLRNCGLQSLLPGGDRNTRLAEEHDHEIALQLEADEAML